MAKEKFMLIAISEADNNLQTNEGGPFGAVVVKDDKIVCSSITTQLAMQKLKPFAMLAKI